MERSIDRILTTHVGSLVRPRPIIECMRARTLDPDSDVSRCETIISREVCAVVRKQVEIGIDIPNDGEYGRRGWTSYINERLSNLEPRDVDPDEAPFQVERAEFPEFFEYYDRHSRQLWMPPELALDERVAVTANHELFRLTGPLEYIGHAGIAADVERLRTALSGHTVADAFITAVTPVSRKNDRNVLDFYPDEESYLYAVADAMHQEYQAITDAGFILQLDFAALNPQEHLLKSRRNPTPEELDKARDFGVELTNYALRGIPEDRVRYHHCWGSDNRPHIHDVPLRDIVHQMLKLNVQAYGFEAANPRHEHEWTVWQDVKLPDGKLLMPGVISQSTNVVEHPELVAWRIKNFADLVGKENVIAGTDCGFSQSWDQVRVHPSVQWAKLAALVEGARLATNELWKS